jgi:hypothetical protein
MKHGEKEHKKKSYHYGKELPSPAHPEILHDLSFVFIGHHYNG